MTRVRGHHLHLMLGDRKHILLARPASLYDENTPALPIRLHFEAVWIYNFTTQKVIKNKTEKNFIPVYDAEEVDSEWLKKHGYIIDWPNR